uniref:transmembrane protein 252-like n=1 Tax=Scatophagus argus TaxID=75038 RepID=UPI001ED85948|nr:transmembrane protein 252-like [Scatophagus argus]
MNVKKQLLSLAHIAMAGVGFVLTCSGAYVLSLQTVYGYSWRVIFGYGLIVAGTLAVLVGVFWSICHSIKSKMYRGGQHEQHIQVYTIERPRSFPPSYEESQDTQVCRRAAPESVVHGVDVVMSLAPPLYSQDSSESPDCRWSWEQPPRYSQVQRIQQEAEADGSREASNGCWSIN